MANISLHKPIALFTLIFAAVMLASAGGAASAAGLRETATTAKLTWLSLPLRNAALINASDLVNDIQTVAGVQVDTIEQWNPIGQNYSTYIHSIGIGNFALTTGGSYRLSVTTDGAVNWSLIGSVPSASTFTYTLHETASSDFNWVMIPLDKSTIATASQLADDIEADSSGMVTVDTVEAWNVSGQNYQSYIASLDLGDFSVNPGFPYRITVKVASGTTVTWPDR